MPKKNSSDKEERQLIIKNLLLSKKVYGQLEVINHLKSKGINASQSTVSRDIKSLGFEESISSGEYIEKDEAIVGNNKTALSNLFKNISFRIYNPKLLAADPNWFKAKNQDVIEENVPESIEQEQNRKKFLNIYCVIIKVTPGYEHATNDFITNIYKERIIGTFVGFQCIFIISSKSESKKIANELRAIKNS